MIKKKYKIPSAKFFAFVVPCSICLGSDYSKPGDDDDYYEDDRY